MNDTLLRVLLALLGITLASWAVIALANVNPKLLGALLLAMAFLKAHLIIRHYMEAPAAGPMIRIGFTAWVWVTGGTCLVIYLQ